MGPTNARGWLIRGRLRALNRDHPQAISALEEVLRLKADDADADIWYDFGLLHALTNNRRAATGAYDRLKQLDAAKANRFQREVLSPTADGDDQRPSPECRSTVTFPAVLPHPRGSDALPSPAVPTGTLSPIPIPSSVPGTRRGMPSFSEMDAEGPTAEIDTQNVTAALVHDPRGLV